jgi:hypothetical protein
LLRSWLRPHRGISREKLPLYLGFFEFVHNVRRRGKALLGLLISTWTYILPPCVAGKRACHSTVCVMRCAKTFVRLLRTTRLKRP